MQISLIEITGQKVLVFQVIFLSEFGYITLDPIKKAQTEIWVWLFVEYLSTIITHNSHWYDVTMSWAKNKYWKYCLSHIPSLGRSCFSNIDVLCVNAVRKLTVSNTKLLGQSKCNTIFKYVKRSLWRSRSAAILDFITWSISLILFAVEYQYLAQK